MFTFPFFVLFSFQCQSVCYGDWQERICCNATGTEAKEGSSSLHHCWYFTQTSWNNTGIHSTRVTSTESGTVSSSPQSFHVWYVFCWDEYSLFSCEIISLSSQQFNIQIKKSRTRRDKQNSSAKHYKQKNKGNLVTGRIQPIRKVRFD